jgi:hypothetical protein
MGAGKDRHLPLMQVLDGVGLRDLSLWDKKDDNGDRSLEQILAHMAEDSLVGWAWNPGYGREPAPGTQKAFGALLKAWIETGAACP